MRRQLCRQQAFARSQGEVFAFFADPRNLEQITPPWLHFQILTPDIVMAAGTLIDYRLRVRGLPIRWRTEIVVWEPPHCFVDRQIRGPYRLWEHTHCFEERDGATWMEDLVEYQVPGGWLEPLLHRWLVGPDLARIFDYRARTIGELLQPS